MSYVVKTQVNGETHYFAGTVRLMVGMGTVYAISIFDAWPMDDRAEADEAVANLGQGWEVSEIMRQGSSVDGDDAA